MCFAIGTSIRQLDGSVIAIEDVVPGHVVAAFDHFGGLVERRVIRIFRGVTDRWIKLSNGLVVTPNHLFLTRGGFKTIADIIANDSMVVLADGGQERLSGEWILYSASTAADFEQAEQLSFGRLGATALAPELIKGWRTYNFEVEDLHTYVAGGVRVHNDCPEYLSTTSGNLVSEHATWVVDVKTGTLEPMMVYRQGGLQTDVAETTVAYNPAGYVSAVTGQQLFAIETSRYNPDTNTFNPVIEFRPGSTTALQQQAGSYSASNYQIQSGDTLSQIAQQNGTTVSALLNANPGLADPNKIYAGQTLTIPGATSSSSHSSNSGQGQTTSSPLVNLGNGNSYNPSTGYAEGQKVDSQGYYFASDGSGTLKNVNWPVLLDLDGNGVSINPLSSSDTFFDMAGDGLKHRTAWAGVGDGVLVLDLGNDGVIDQQKEIDFTQWDPTATSDMQALRDVFDTNHDGKLDAGDADWSLIQGDGHQCRRHDDAQDAGAARHHLDQSDQQQSGDDRGRRLARSLGTTTYTKSGGGTGTVGDASSPTTANGYVVAQTVTHNGDGSTTIDNRATDAVWQSRQRHQHDDQRRRPDPDHQVRRQWRRRVRSYPDRHQGHSMPTARSPRRCRPMMAAARS